MSKKYKILALMGPSCSGKDTVLNWMVSNLPNLHKIIPTTTRPKRDYEIEDKDYHFVTAREFSDTLINTNQYIEATSYNGWYYATNTNDLSIDKVNIGIFSPQAVDILLDDRNVKILPVLINVDNKTLLLRALNREIFPDCDEICRRFLADRKDFDNIPFYYEVYDNRPDSDYFNLHKIPAVAEFLGQN